MTTESIRPVRISPAQIRAARALLGIEQTKLAAAVGLARQTIIAIEAGAFGRPDARRQKNMDAIRAILEDEFAIEFLPASETAGEGVRFRKSLVRD
jgi:DNA-binding XRE family transcriptional regulator